MTGVLPSRELGARASGAHGAGTSAEGGARRKLPPLAAFTDGQDR
jgi:hypothetical protein